MGSTSWGPISAPATGAHRAEMGATGRGSVASATQCRRWRFSRKTWVSTASVAGCGSRSAESSERWSPRRRGSTRRRLFLEPALKRFPLNVVPIEERLARSDNPLADFKQLLHELSLGLEAIEALRSFLLRHESNIPTSRCGRVHGFSPGDDGERLGRQVLRGPRRIQAKPGAGLSRRHEGPVAVADALVEGERF